MTMSHLICDKDAPPSVHPFVPLLGRQKRCGLSADKSLCLTDLQKRRRGQGQEQDDHYKNSLWSLFSPPLHVVVVVAVAGCHLFVFLCA